MQAHQEALTGFTLPSWALPAGIWLRRLRTRTALRELDPRQLLDVGLSEATRQRECGKWFWEA